MKKFLKTILIIFLVVIVIVVGINFIVVGTTYGDIKATSTSINGEITSDEIGLLKNQEPDCILVLGAGVKPDGSPTVMLEDRLKTGVYLYKAGVAKKLLLSGDNGQVEYNEVKCMRNYALANGVDKKDIFLDHAGFSTYESMYRAQAIFNVKNAVVVTQKYHEYRALYIGKRFGMTVTGVSTINKKYDGQAARDLREVLARDKDFFKAIIKVKPTYLGEPIPITGDGQKTW